MVRLFCMHGLVVPDAGEKNPAVDERSLAWGAGGRDLGKQCVDGRSGAEYPAVNGATFANHCGSDARAGSPSGNHRQHCGCQRRKPFVHDRKIASGIITNRRTSSSGEQLSGKLRADEHLESLHKGKSGCYTAGSANRNPNNVCRFNPCRRLGDQHVIEGGGERTAIQYDRQRGAADTQRPASSWQVGLLPNLRVSMGS